MHLPPLVQSFVLHFGEMGSRWGINRTVGQIYALLHVSPEPLNADQIVDALGVSRSNVSMGLRELLMQAPGSEAERHAQARMAEMHGLIERLTTWYEDVRRPEAERLAQLLSLGSRVAKLVEATDRVVAFGKPRRRKDSA